MQYIVAPKFIISLIPKVGTRSLLSTFVRSPSKNYRALWKSDLSEVNTNARFKIVFVREPYSRLLSCYINKVKFAAPVIKEHFWKLYGLRDMTFEEFVCHIQECPRDEHWRPQIDFVNKMNHDFIGTLDNMESDINDIMKRLEIPYTLDMPHLNYSDDKRVTYDKQKQYLDKKQEKVNEVGLDKYYTNELRKVVREMYQKDFELYDSIKR